MSKILQFPNINDDAETSRMEDWRFEVDDSTGNLRMRNVVTNELTDVSTSDLAHAANDMLSCIEELKSALDDIREIFYGEDD